MPFQEFQKEKVIWGSDTPSPQPEGKIQRAGSEDARVTVGEWLQKFQHAVNSGNIGVAVKLFETGGFWRDLVAFTWNLYTAEGQEDIRKMLEATLKHVKPFTCQMTEANEQDGVATGWFSFQTSIGRGTGVLRLRNGLCWTLLTSLTELIGYEERRGATRALGAEHVVTKGDKPNWFDRRIQEAEELGFCAQPYVLIIGGGQGGLAVGARLKQLNVPTIIVDKYPRAGDQWRSRYKSLCLHDPVWYDHLPYIPFPDTWPVFTPKDKIGDWLEMYAKTMELNYWSSTECTNATWDDTSKEWIVNVNKNGMPVTLRPKQLVFATGMSGMPSVPSYKGASLFKGRQHHSSQHPGGAEFKDKKVVVIGANNSAHDICADLYQHGADVTMIQRSTTHVARSSSLMEHALGTLYSEKALANGITTEKADLTNASIPYCVMPSFHIPVYEKIKKQDAEFYNRLEKAGFMLDFGDDGSGLFMKYIRRGSGYYIDVGASELVANGSIKLKSPVEVEEIREHSIVLSDGSELEADVMVYATGYSSMNGWVAKLVSQEVADRVGKVWGLGSNTTKDPGPWEGELRNVWKPTKQEALWFHGGNLAQSRFYSSHIALQLKARMEGIPTPVYGMHDVYHKA